MYPAQTSFIPVQIALARFLESQGLKAIFANYPYWYLGTTSFRYLTGPILPSLLVLSHKLLSGLTLFELFFGWLGAIWVVGIIGVYWLVKELGGKRIAVLAALFYAFGPIVPFLFRFSGGLYLIAFSFLPFVLILYSRFLKKATGGLTFGLMIAISLLGLLDLAAVPSMLVGMAAIFLAQVGWKGVEEKLKQTFLIFTFSFLICTFWYTPGYWLTSLAGPSLAGKERLGVIFQLSRLLPTVLALAVAIFSVKFFKKRQLLRDFTFYWLFIFGFLTLIRFFSDPDFWLDWMAYGLELQFGVAIEAGLIVNGFLATLRHTQKISVFQKAFIVSVILLFLFGTWLIVVNRHILGTLQKDINQSVEYKIGKFLSEIVKPEEKVFLSGTTAFWLNAFFDVAHVRGGVDQASVHPTWRRAAWEIREGSHVKESIKWLDELGINYLVVHSLESSEFYHDFVYPEKFEKTSRLEKIYDYQGDMIYKRR